MQQGLGYVYRAEGHTYILDPEFTVGANKIRLIGAGIFNMQVEYLGYWDRFNMPVDLIHHLTAWIKRERAQEIATRRMAMFKGQPKPKL